MVAAVLSVMCYHSAVAKPQKKTENIWQGVEEQGCVIRATNSPICDHGFT